MSRNAAGLKALRGSTTRSGRLIELAGAGDRASAPLSPERACGRHDVVRGLSERSPETGPSSDIELVAEAIRSGKVLEAAER